MHYRIRKKANNFQCQNVIEHQYHSYYHYCQGHGCLNVVLKITIDLLIHSTYFLCKRKPLRPEKMSTRESAYGGLEMQCMLLVSGAVFHCISLRGTLDKTNDTKIKQK